jgi:hypothetical protein
MMEQYQVTNNIDLLLKQQNQSKTDKDESNKSSKSQLTKSARPNQRKMILMHRRPKGLA